MSSRSAPRAGAKRTPESSNHDRPEKKARTDDIERMGRDELVAKVREQSAHVASLEALLGTVRQNANTASKSDLAPGQGKRENLLVMRLAQKDQEIQEHLARIAELNQALMPSSLQMKAALVDPLVNNLFSRLKAELKAYKESAEEARQELESTKFTPDSTTGKRLLAKCKLLMEENAELGRHLSEGRVVDMETELELQRQYANELRQRNEEMQEFVGQLDEELEHMQAAVLRLHHQNLELTKERNLLKEEVKSLRAGCSANGDHDSGNSQTLAQEAINGERAAAKSVNSNLDDPQEVPHGSTQQENPSEPMAAEGDESTAANGV